MLYAVVQKHERQHFMDKYAAYDCLIREIIKNNIDTSNMYVPDIGIEVYDSSIEPMTFVEYLVVDNLENFMYVNDFSFDDIYIEPKIVYPLIKPQPLYDFECF